MPRNLTKLLNKRLEMDIDINDILDNFFLINGEDIGDFLEIFKNPCLVEIWELNTDGTKTKVESEIDIDIRALYCIEKNSVNNN